MAEWAPWGNSALVWSSRLIVLALLIGATASQSVQAQSNRTSSGLTSGIPVAYESSDGSASLTLTVEEVIDPFQGGITAYDQDRLASEEKRYVGVRLEVGNDAPEPLAYFFTSDIRLLDAGADLHTPRSVQRDIETGAADPELLSGEVAAGGSISGLLFYELPDASDIEAILFTPSPDRSIALAHRGSPPALTAESESGPPDAVAEPPEVEAPLPPEVEAEPPATEALPQADIEPVEARGSYQAPTFGHVATWDPSQWSVIEATSAPDHDLLVLAGAVVTIELEGLEDASPQRCLTDRVYADLDEVSGFDAAPDDVLAPTVTGRMPPDAGIYLITRDGDRPVGELVRYVECRPLRPGEAVVRIVVTAPQRYWALDRELATAVLSNVIPPGLAPPANEAPPSESSPPPDGTTPASA